MTLHWTERAERFTAIDANGCWMSSYAVNYKGYSRIRVGQKNVGIHRLSYQFFKGEIPRGMFVCHACDVRNCWNPDHLFVGSHLDNMKDMALKSRAASGEKNGSSKLTDVEVTAIRNRSIRGESQRNLARDFGVSLGTIWNICSNRTWDHLTARSSP